MIGHNDDGLSIGKIILKKWLFIKTLQFITEKNHTVHFTYIDAYHTTPIPKPYCCVTQEELLDFCPLPKYMVRGMSLLILHHCVPTFQINVILRLCYKRDDPQGFA